MEYMHFITIKLEGEFMMAKKALGVAALALVMVPASATIARLEALGMNETDNEGSYYIKDDRNIFLNVANIHNYKDTAIIEWGSDGKNFGGSALQTDENEDPKAKGGIIKSSGNYVYGIYVGNESNTSSLLRGVGTGAYASLQQAPLTGADNQIDLFFGGSTSSMKWAVNGVYAADHQQGSYRSSASAVRVGAMTDKWDAFLNLSTGNDVTNQTTLAGAAATAGGVSGQTLVHSFEGKFGFHIGGGYQLNENGRLYGFAKKFDWEQFDSVGATAGALGNNGNRGQLGTVEGGFMTYALGYGATYEMGKGTLYTNIEYRHTSIEVDFTAKAEAENNQVPLTVAYEYMATGWLTLRGSVTQRIYNTRDNKNYTSLNAFGNSAATSQFGSQGEGTRPNTTDITAGASLMFGKLKVDGLLGFGGTNGNISTTERGVLDGDRLLARVGMVYNF